MTQPKPRHPGSESAGLLYHHLGTAVRLNGTPSEEASQALLMGMEYRKYTHSHSSVFHLFVKHSYQCCHFDKVCDIMIVAGMRDRSVCYITSHCSLLFIGKEWNSMVYLYARWIILFYCVCFKFELFSATPWRAQVWSLPTHPVFPPQKYWQQQYKASKWNYNYLHISCVFRPTCFFPWGCLEQCINKILSMNGRQRRH